MLGCVAKIRQQGKEQIGVAIAEIADLHGFEQIVDVLRPCQQGGDDHHGAMAVRNPFGKIHAGQGARRQGERDQQVHQRNGQCRGGDDEGKRKKPEPPVTRIEPARIEVEHGQHDRCRKQREQQDGAEVQGQTDMPACPPDAGAQRQPAADRTFQARPSLIDQVVADMCAAVVDALLRGSRLRENDGFARHRHFAACAASRHVLDDMPVAIAGGELWLA